MWLVDPVRVKPAAQIVYGSKVLLQDSVNGETGAGSSAIRITTGIFSTWRAAGITCEHELFVTSIALLSLAALFILAGWYHNHIVVALSSVSIYTGFTPGGVEFSLYLHWVHLVHVSLPVDVLLRLGCDPLSLPESGKTLDPALSGLLLSGGTLADVFTLNWTGLTGLLTLFGGLNPATGSLWLSDIAHHHLAVAVVFLVAGHLYRTQFSVGTRLTH